MMTTKVFNGASVFMSRNLVPPEEFDALHDALKHNGALVFLCCDPSRNSCTDYHVISSPHHEKFGDLQAKGCNLIGPQCVLSCAKEQRPLPQQGFTCCLAMDGVKILASGFEMDEKVELGKLVSAMGGVLHTKASLDVSFVIVKNVLAAKYKWAVNKLKKPIVTIDWLQQCWKEHRLVPQESFKVLPFSGLTICVTRIPIDERKEMEKIILQNGGKYSPELTRKCSHLICNAPEGEKYKVAKRWGHIHTVTKRWFDQSVARRACLDEESYPVQAGSPNTMTTLRMTNQHSLKKGMRNLQGLSSLATPSNAEPVLCSGASDSYVEATLSQDMSDAPVLTKEEENLAPAENPKSDYSAPVSTKNEQSGAPIEQEKNDCDGGVADDSQTDDNDFYLADCRILIVGFNASEMRKLVNLVRKGGGSRYMSFGEKLTHIIAGNPSENEIKELRNLAALGVVHVVKSGWLQDCDREKKEVPVLRKHIAYDLLLPKDPIHCSNGAGTSTSMKRQGKSYVHTISSDEHAWRGTDSGCTMPSDKNKELENMNDIRTSLRENGVQHQPYSSNHKDEKLLNESGCAVNGRKPSSVFEGRRFCFSASFPVDRRAEIVEWVSQGGGVVVEDQTETNVHFTVECHGTLRSEKDGAAATFVSSHWIKSCLEDGCLLDVGSHILYSPLPCRVPFPAFQSFHFCVSQYDEKERQLLRNLCFTIGAKFAEKLTKRVTHLLCKFISGPKYEVACKWGIQPVTCEWIYECIKLNKIVSPDPFYPKEVTSEDREAGVCTTSQFPTQAVRMISGDTSSQPQSQPQELINLRTEAFAGRSIAKEEMKHSSRWNKKARLLVVEETNCSLTCVSNENNAFCGTNPPEKNMIGSTKEGSSAVPDVAAAIEDLLEQTSKIHDQKSPSRIECDKELFTSGCNTLAQGHGDHHTTLGLSNDWTTRFEKKDDSHGHSGDATANVYDHFSETQTDSQVVGYAEDLSGRQMIIDRVRTRSSGLT
ncbi:PREDICTED: DNA topoisomerase 2-binding protein 1 [Nicotiana attenuata]|uniref:DNA topoisomerase 2-binding protein 1 n=1 Tax=Nicotiana attenuata TaxID=49451 RepID=UPI0009058BC4|nr:PREDICTED: DNA topoisomerase 2-binding protein 1 [Nicotiana attenuata]